MWKSWKVPKIFFKNAIFSPKNCKTRRLAVFRIEETAYLKRLKSDVFFECIGNKTNSPVKYKDLPVPR
jgi:hypothetical protein